MARILVIDDEEMVRLTLRQILEKAGHEVREASNGRQGEELHLADPADLIIIDIIMPDQEGLETILRIRTKDPAVRIIAVSGTGQVGAKDHLDYARKFGAVSVFEKPFDRKALLAAVEAGLAGD